MYATVSVIVAEYEPLACCGAGVAVPIVLTAFFLFSRSLPWFAIAAAVLALMGLYSFEDLWVKAGQSVPLS